jgi:hypothetical protein
MNPRQQKIYDIAKDSLGKHITLNTNVPNEVGCAEAVSYVLKKASIGSLPVSGFAGTADLYRFLLDNNQFHLIEQPEQGAIIVSPTGFGNGKVEGHTGILGGFGVQFPNEYGILSNNSDNGLFQEKWNLLTWWENYGLKGHLPVALFRAL